MAAESTVSAYIKTSGLRGMQNETDPFKVSTAINKRLFQEISIRPDRVSCFSEYPGQPSIKSIWKEIQAKDLYEHQDAMNE